MRRPRTARTEVETGRPRVFIGSSTEGLEVARAVQAALYYEAEPILWSQGVFGLSGGTLETLVAEVHAFDFAVFILTADDLIVRRGRRVRGNAPRDNVLFELGLFMGTLGRERTFYVNCKSDALLLPTDLAGITSATYISPSEPKYLQSALSAATTPILSAIRTIGKKTKPVGDNSSGLSKEIDDLRTQVSEMRISLSSFAAYAEAIREREPSTASGVPRSTTSVDLRFLEGTWRSSPTGSTAWCRTIMGKTIFLYCYHGDDKPTGEYYSWTIHGNTLRGQFRWFYDKNIDGYAWFEIVDTHTLKGGWWMSRDVPSSLVESLPHVPRMVPSGWEKISNVIPVRIRPFFRRAAIGEGDRKTKFIGTAANKAL